ncbi:Transmembrane protease serine 6 [Dufourea novaeangliae]|uniref:Transmembrane protease serine 6 n=1 Tax=Dufourea novaeangliae TaxID=178035 RepID=A0A154PBY1_DUFNO|nr:Transmembrane protease serine 6 [Dufourea novaeangliae]
MAHPHEGADDPYTLTHCRGLQVEPPVVTNEDINLNITLTNSTMTDDKNFWEWLYGFVGVPTLPTIAAPSPVKDETCSPCKCGLTNTQKRIVGGTETQVNQYPWMALMMFRGRFYCGGSIINSRYVLTASHCVDRFDPKLITVRILEHDRNSSSEAQTQTFKVDKVMKHSGYSTFNYNNDIALVRLQEPIRFVGKMRPACLPDRAKTFAGIKAIVTGWGALEESGAISETLQEVSVPILTNTECRASKYPSRRITDNMLCAGYKEGSKDSCQGDSGGPLHVINGNTYNIVGVVSWGEGCAKPGYPGVYSRVNRYLTWIKRNTEDACYC